MTFSVLQWSCPSYEASSGPLVPWILLVLGVLFVVLALFPGVRVSGAFSRQPGVPAQVHHRVIFGIVGLLAFYEGLKIVIICKVGS